MVKTCIMIEEVMYGPAPSITIERLESPPPEKIFKRPKNWLLEKKAASAFLSTPGIGTDARKRKSASAPMTKNMRKRISGSPKASVSFRINELSMNGATDRRERLAGGGRNGASSHRERLG